MHGSCTRTCPWSIYFVRRKCTRATPPYLCPCCSKCERRGAITYLQPLRVKQAHPASHQDLHITRQLVLYAWVPGKTARLRAGGGNILRSTCELESKQTRDVERQTSSSFKACIKMIDDNCLLDTLSAAHKKWAHLECSYSYMYLVALSGLLYHYSCCTLYTVPGRAN